MSSDWQFISLAILDIYEVVDPLVRSAQLVYARSIANGPQPANKEYASKLERKICMDMNKTNKSISQLIRGQRNSPLYWKARIDLTESGHQTTFLVPEISANCIMIDHFGENRSLRVMIKYDVPPVIPSSPKKPIHKLHKLQYASKCVKCNRVMHPGEYSSKYDGPSTGHKIWKFHCESCANAAPDSPTGPEPAATLTPLSKLNKTGIIFGGRKFQFVFGEINKSNARSVEEDKGGIAAFFFAVHEEPLLPSTSMTPIPIPAVRAYLADFADFRSLYKESYLYKLNARLKLGYSPSLGCLDVRDSQVILIDDISAPGGGIMTDGCGFIAPDLAALVPFNINSGRPSPLQRGPLLPVVIQIRFSSKKGLFKGLLIVCKDEQVCPKSKIVMRKSMRKAAGPLRLTETQGDSPTPLYVHCTFEQSQSRRRGESSSIQTAYLNRSFCLLLACLGVPEHLFMDLLEVEIERVTQPTHDRAAAYKLARASLARSRADIALSQDVENDDDVMDSFVSTPSNRDLYRNDTSYALVAQDVMTMLQCGFDLTEPFLAKKITTLQLYGMDNLKECRLRLHDAAYFVGVPDPTGTLLKGEVFIALPNNGASNSTPSHPQGRVIVTRNPMSHPGDVRVLESVKNSALSEFLRGTCGAVIFFSIHGERSPADEMGGGDYDGDEYLVLWGRSDFVGMVQQVAAFGAAVAAAAAEEKEDLPGESESDMEQADRQENGDASLSAAAKRNISQISPAEPRTPVKKSNGRSGMSSISPTTHTSAPPSPGPPTKFPSNVYTSIPSPAPGRITEDFFWDETDDLPLVLTGSFSPSRLPATTLAAGMAAEASKKQGALRSVKACQQDFTDDTGYRSLLALVTMARDSSIGQGANTWLALADEFGPGHPDALAADGVCRQLLDASKNGLVAQGPLRRLRNKACKPHYMYTPPTLTSQAGPNSHSFSLSQNASSSPTIALWSPLEVERRIAVGELRRSTSIAGKVFDAVTRVKDSIDQQYEKMRFEVDQIDSAVDMSSLTELFVSAMLDKEMLAVIDGDAQLDLLQELNGSGHCHANIMRLLTRWLGYQAEFNRRLSDIIALPDDKESQREKMRLKKLLGEDFEERVRSDAMELLNIHIHPAIGSYRNARCLLAIIIYYAVYNKHPSDCCGKKPLEFCWKMCFVELCVVKKEAMLRKLGEHIMKPGHPRSEDRFV